MWCFALLRRIKSAVLRGGSQRCHCTSSSEAGYCGDQILTSRCLFSVTIQILNSGRRLQKFQKFYNFRMVKKKHAPKSSRCVFHNICAILITKNVPNIEYSLSNSTPSWEKPWFPPAYKRFIVLFSISMTLFLMVVKLCKNLKTHFVQCKSLQGW